MHSLYGTGAVTEYGYGASATAVACVSGVLCCLHYIWHSSIMGGRPSTVHGAACGAWLARAAVVGWHSHCGAVADALKYFWTSGLAALYAGYIPWCIWSADERQCKKTCGNRRGVESLCRMCTCMKVRGLSAPCSATSGLPVACHHT